MATKSKFVIHFYGFLGTPRDKANPDFIAESGSLAGARRYAKSVIREERAKCAEVWQVFPDFAAGEMVAFVK